MNLNPTIFYWKYIFDLSYTWAPFEYIFNILESILNQATKPQTKNPVRANHFIPIIFNWPHLEGLDIHILTPNQSSLHTYSFYIINMAYFWIV